MLTDEEIMDIRNRAKLNDNRQINPMLFARDIERAVLAKAMPIPKQEPLGYIDPEEISDGKIYGYASLCGIKSDSVSTPVYLHPQPAQAAAIPEYEIIGYTTRYFIEDCKKGNQSFSCSWLQEHCPNHDSVAIAVLSASTKPE